MSDLKTPMPELLPCPFCGSDDVELSEFDASCYVQCATCLCQGPEQVEEDVAINDWNYRASPWQPIETAPKDVAVLLYVPGKSGSPALYLQGYWDEGQGRWWTGTMFEHSPTRWMPIQPASEDV